jgi:hypothetical protein
MSDPPSPRPTDPATPRQARLSDVFRAVFWSFFGVRKRRHLQEDAASIRPHQLIIVGLVTAAALVLALILIVRLIVGAAAR